MHGEHNQRYGLLGREGINWDCEVGFSFGRKLYDARYSDGLLRRSRRTGRELWHNCKVGCGSKCLLEIFKLFSNVVVISFKLDFKIPLPDSEPQLLLRRQ